MMKQHRLISGFVQTALAGGLLGILVQAAQAREYYGVFRNAFATVSYGLFFWIVICTAISYHSRCGLHASLLVLCLLIPVLCGYTLTAQYFGCYLNRNVLGLGMLLLLPAALAAWILRAYRDRRGMRIFAGIAGGAAMLFDFFARGDFDFRSVVLSFLLLLYYLSMLHSFSPQRDVVLIYD